MDHRDAATTNNTPRKAAVVKGPEHECTAKAARADNVRRTPLKRQLLDGATQAAKASKSGADTRLAASAVEEDITTQVAVAGTSQVYPSPSKRMQIQPAPDVHVRRYAYDISSF